jgi:phage terminase large subunit-like protein
MLTRGERNCRFIERYCVVPEGDAVGKPIRLIDEQVMFYLSVYDNPYGTDTAIKSVARKNSKTGDIAFLLLVHLVGPEAKQNSRIISGALSREQAAEVYNYASKCVMLSEKLSSICKIIPSRKSIIGLPLHVEYQAISADAHTAHGKSPIVAILDEVGQIRGAQSDFVDAISTAQGAYNDPLLIYISTQAPTDGDFFSVQIDDAINNKPPKTVCHVFTAPEDCNLMDESAWKMANPALGVFRSYDDVKKQAEKALRLPSFEPTFRNLILNQRVATESMFVARTIWEENGAKPDSLKGKKVFGGLDLSAVSDLTALVLVSSEGDTESIFWLPGEGIIEKSKNDRVPYDLWAKQGFLRTTPGKSIEYEYIAHELKRVFDEYEVMQINFDRALMRHLRPWLVKVGFTELQLEKFVDYGQGFISMHPALRDLESMLLQKKLKHGNHPVLTMCASNAKVETDAAGSRKFTKKKSNGRIDGMVSLAMAVAALNATKINTDNEWSIHFI